MQTAVKTKKPRKQAVSGCFWANRTYRGRIKDDHKIDLGIGKPEILHGDLSGFKSRRINETDRLVYRLKEGTIEIASCRGHYGN